MKKIYFALGLSLLILSCSDNNNSEPQPNSDENRFIRLLVSDENTNNLTLLNPSTQKIEKFEALFPKSSLYSSGSKRFAGIVHRTNNYFQTFDSGLEFHGDHVDLAGTPKFGAMVGQSPLPTHFKSSNGMMLLFNDGDGTLSYGLESDVHLQGKQMEKINTNLLAHHGAMAAFSNGNFAITQKDNSIKGSLPERVKIINRNGSTVSESTIATLGIHGNATDGDNAVFGSASGVLVVKSNGNQRLISYPESFGEAWFGTILETDFEGKFIGYTNAKGAFIIDLNSDQIKPIIESTDIMQCVVSYNKKQLGIITLSGEVSIFEIENQQRVFNHSVISAVEKTETSKPKFAFNSKKIYITRPQTGELLMIDTKNKELKNTFSIEGKPFSLVILGYETDEAH